MIMDWWIHVSGRGHSTMLWFPDILSVRPPVTRSVAGARLQEEGCAKLLGAGSVAWHNWAPNSEVVAYYKNCWLVVWNIFYFSTITLGRIIPTDFHVFQRGSNHQTDYTSLWRNHQTNPQNQGAWEMPRDARWTTILSQVHSLKLGMIAHSCWVLLVNEWLLFNIHICYWLIFWCWMIGWHTAFSAIFCFFCQCLSCWWAA